MGKRNFGLLITASITLALGMASFALCIASEFKKAEGGQRKDLKLDGRLCFLPDSEAFELGISALACLCLAHIIGNFIMCKCSCSGENRRSCYNKRSVFRILFLSLSWISFVIAVVLISTSTSMNTRQDYGKGWLDGDCYVVKDGVLSGSGVLVLVSVGSTITSTILKKSRSQVDFKPVHSTTKNKSPT